MVQLHRAGATDSFNRVDFSKAIGMPAYFSEFKALFGTEFPKSEMGISCPVERNDRSEGVILCVCAAADVASSRPTPVNHICYAFCLYRIGANRSTRRMSMHTWWLFVMMTFVVSATPGPNMLLVMSHSARFGFRRALATMAGCMTALLAMMSLSAAGLGALLQAFPTVFDTLRWIGAAYLAYLGIKSWRAPVQDASQPASMDESLRSATAGQLYRQGMLVAASNPKAILFAAAFFPQFIRPELPQMTQFVILLTTFSVIEVAWYLVYAGSGQRLAAYLRRATVLKVFNRLTGGAFVGFAALMAASRG